MKHLLTTLVALALLTFGASAQDRTMPGRYEAAPATVVEGQWAPALIDSTRRLVTVSVGPYQFGQTALIAGSGNVANASAAATLTGTASTTVYISGFEITAGGATGASLVQVTVSGLLGGSRIFTFGFPAGATLMATPLLVTFTPPLPASAVNTPITVTVPAGGAGNTNSTVVSHGFYQ